MDINTLYLAKKHTSQEIEKVNQTINNITTGIKSIVPNGNQLIFTLSDDSQISVTLTGLSSNDFSNIYKNKLDSLDGTVLSLFTYVDNQLLFNGSPIIGGSVDLSAYALKNGNIDENFSMNNATIKGNIMPSSNGLQDIGSPTNRFGAIYVNEAMLSTNTLYIGDTPVLGTTDDTIMIKADPDQSITMKTIGVGTTKVISESGVELSTSGMNANVNVQATGSGANANLSATNQVNLNAPNINLVGDMDVSGNTAIDNLTVRGNLVINGGSTTIESTTVRVEDNIIELNKNEVGYGVTAGKSGLKINRGDADDYLIVFDETDDKLKIGVDSLLKIISTEEYVDNKTVNKLETTNIKAGSNISVNVSGNDVTINSTGGTEGVSDLSSFTTDDLVESVTKKYTSPTEKETWNNKLDKTNIKGGTNVNVTTSGTDVTINVTGSDATSINNVPVDNSSLSDGRVLMYNQSLNRYENANVTVVGIVGSTGDIIQPSGVPVTLTSGQEIILNHPSVTDDKIMINVQEIIPSSNVTDTHVDFSDSSKYILQDITKVLFYSNSLKLNAGASCIANYKFNETGGTTCIDSKGTYNGIYTGTTSVTDTSQGISNTYRIFNGTSDYIGFSNYVIPLTKKSIKFKIKLDLSIASTKFLFSTYEIGTSGVYSTITSTGKIRFGHTDGTTYNHVESNTSINDNIWHTVLFVDNGITLKVFIDNFVTEDASITKTLFISGHSRNFLIGGVSNDTANYYKFQGHLDELEIYNDVVNLDLTPTYIKTTSLSNLSLSTINTITSLTIPTTIPTNTSVKCLFSVDNQANWLYKDITGIHKYTGDLTTSWTSSNTNTELQTYFTNLSISQLTTDLSSLGTIPVSLDFAFQLNTSDITVTPTISSITMVYTTKPHTEFTSYGGYSETSVRFGVKRINSTQLGIKNLSTSTRTVSANVILGTS